VRYTAEYSKDSQFEIIDVQIADSADSRLSRREVDNMKYSQEIAAVAVVR
jgi:hypothetical protein